jgi:hypothetical protein
VLHPGPDEGEPGGLAVVVLDAAAGCRPAGEVAELLRLLAGHTFPGAETALRAAAVSRPVDDLAELVMALGQDDPAGDLVLTEAVLRRPVGEVAQLAALAGEHASAAFGRALARAALVRPVADVADMVRTLPMTGPRPAVLPAPADAGSSRAPEDADAKAPRVRALRWPGAAAARN